MKTGHARLSPALVVVFNLDSFPSGDNAWRLYLVNANTATGANITLFATCIR